MKHKLLGWISIIVLILVTGSLLSWYFYVPTKEITWGQTIQILDTGKVTQVSQDGLNVYLKIDVGDKYKTTQPQINSINSEISKCGDVCKNIVIK